MAIVKCSQGLHFYDDSKNSGCPHCDSSVKPIKRTASQLGEQITVKKSNIEEDIISYTRDNSYALSGDDARTISYVSSLKGNDFVTGWLVCVEGPEMGRDYRLYHGFNRVGRRQDMDVLIMEDRQISGDTHCSIVYDPRSNSFFVTPSGKNLTYLNDELVTRGCPISSGDIIGIGMSKFEFIAFCRDSRKWDMTKD